VLLHCASFILSKIVIGSKVIMGNTYLIFYNILLWESYLQNIEITPKPKMANPP
jgi:hypothetical protein